MRGMRGERRYLAGPPDVPGVRVRRLLRHVEKPAHEGAPRVDRASDLPLHPDGRGLDLVLRGQRLHRAVPPGRRPLMAYMVQQRIVSAIREAYADRPDRDRHLAAATGCREWLGRLEGEARLWGSLVWRIAAGGGSP